MIHTFHKYSHLGLLIVAMVGQRAFAQAGSVPVTSLSVNRAFGLTSFVAGGKAYLPEDLIQPKMTGYYGIGGIQVPSGGVVPRAGTRSELVTTDFRLDTGVSNAREVELTFQSGLINGPGPDLIFFDENYYGGVDFRLVANGTSRIFTGAFYDTLLLNTQYHQFFRQGVGRITLGELEADPYIVHTGTSGPSISRVVGIAIDLDDMGVAPGAAISVLNFQVPTEADDSLDPILIMGIRSAVVPEPSALLLTSLACGLAHARSLRR